MIMPAISLALPFAAVMMRNTRSAVLEVLNQDYVRVARAKGLSGPRVLSRHMLPNAALPIITVVGIQVAGLLGGTVIIETIFGLPGLGRYIYDAISNRDYPVVQGVTLVMATIFVIVSMSSTSSTRWSIRACGGRERHGQKLASNANPPSWRRPQRSGRRLHDGPHAEPAIDVGKHPAAAAGPDRPGDHHHLLPYRHLRSVPGALWPTEQFSKHILEPPSGTFLLGTDEFGRDILSRLLYGAGSRSRSGSSRSASPAASASCSG